MVKLLIPVGPSKMLSKTLLIPEKLMILRKCQASKLTLCLNTKTNHYLTIQSHHNQISSLLIHVNLKQVMRQLPHESHISSGILRRESKREPWEFILCESHELPKHLEQRRSVKLFSDVNNELLFYYFASVECLCSLSKVLMEC